MTAEMVAEFEKRYPQAPVIRAVIRRPAEGFSVTALFGPSGCGKTTILRCLAGLERPEQGWIRFADEVWLDTETRVSLPPQRRGIGFLFQDYALFPHLTVEDNIAYGLTGIARQERTRLVAEIMSRFQLDGLGRRYPRQLSGGQQQRVALARVVIRRPRLLLLDEPLSSLDGPTRDQVRRELRQVLRNIGVPTILVTHDQIEAVTLADYVIVLSEGCVRQSGVAEEVLSRPADLTVARIVGIETVVHGTVTDVENGLTTVSVGETQIVALAAGSVGNQVTLCIRGEDVIVQEATKRTSGIRNQLPGRIREMVHEGPMIRVVVDCGFHLTAIITKRTRDELDLHEGVPVTALVKAAAIHVIPRD